MTNKGILYLLLGGLSLIGGIAAIVGISVSDDYARESLANDLNENDTSYALAQTTKEKLTEDLEKLDEFVKEETKTIETKIDEWKKSNDYNKKILTYQTEASEKLSDFKTAIGYEKELSKIDDDLEEAIDAVKERIGYNDKIEAQNKLIEDAKTAYDTATFFMENNQASKDAKKAVRKAKDKTIDTANEKIEEINKTLQKEIKPLKKEAKEKKEALEGRVIAKKTEFDNALERKIEKLNSDLAEARNKIIFEVEKERPSEIQKLIDNKASMLKDRNDLTNVLYQTYQDAYEKLSAEDKLTLYLKANNIKAPVVGFIGLIAGLPIFIVMYEYISAVIRIVERVML